MPKLQWYNSNIRCIEIGYSPDIVHHPEQYNSNIRCIEISDGYNMCASFYGITVTLDVLKSPLAAMPHSPDNV